MQSRVCVKNSVWLNEMIENAKVTEVSVNEIKLEKLESDIVS